MILTEIVFIEFLQMVLNAGMNMILTETGFTKKAMFPGILPTSLYVNMNMTTKATSFIQNLLEQTETLKNSLNMILKTE